MKTKFTIKNVEFSIAGESVKVGEITSEVEDLNLKEYIEVIKAVPGIIRETRIALEEDLDLPDHEDYSVKMQPGDILGMPEKEEDIFSPYNFKQKEQENEFPTF